MTFILFFFLPWHTWWTSHMHDTLRGHRYGGLSITYKFPHTGCNFPFFLHHRAYQNANEWMTIKGLFWNTYFEKANHLVELGILPIIRNKLSERILQPWDSVGYFTPWLFDNHWFRERLTLLLEQRSRSMYPQGKKVETSKEKKNNVKENKL